MKKRDLLMPLGAILILLLAVFCGKGGNLRRMQLLFSLRQQQFSEAAEAALANEPVKNRHLLGSDSYNVWPCEGRDANMMDFSVGGWGIGSQTRYWGFYTTTDGEPTGFQGADMSLTEEEGKWLWQEEDGDNTYTTWQADDNWYYYEMSF